MKIDVANYGGQDFFLLYPSGETLLEEDLERRTMARYFAPRLFSPKKGHISLHVSMHAVSWILEEWAYESLLFTKDGGTVFRRMMRMKERADATHLAMDVLYREIQEPFLEEDVIPELPDDLIPTRPPLLHQKPALAWMHAAHKQLEMTTFALFAKMGTGKTYMSLTWLEYLVETGHVKKALVIAPLFTLYNAWVEDIQKFTSLTYKVLWSGASGKKEQRELQEAFAAKSHIDIINVEGIQEGRRKENIRRTYLDSQAYDMVIVDESNCIMSATGVRFHAACEIGHKAPYRMILTGTPSPRGVMPMWAQMFFLDKGRALDISYGSYQDRYSYVVRDNIRKDRPHAAEEIYERIRPYRFLSERKFLGLPPRRHILHQISMTKRQAKLLDEIKREGYIAPAGEDGLPIDIHCENILSKMLRSMQILNGALSIEEGGEKKKIKIENPKLSAVADVVDIATREYVMGRRTKIIVWGSFRDEIAALAEEIGKRFSKEDTERKVVTAYGETPGGSKAIIKNMKDFQEDEHTCVIVGHPQSIGEGPNLQAANMMIYTSFVSNLRYFLQSMERNYRAGQDREVAVYYFLYRLSPEETVLEGLRNKESVQERIMKGLRAGKTVHDLFSVEDFASRWRQDETPT